MVRRAPLGILLALLLALAALLPPGAGGPAVAAATGDAVWCLTGDHGGSAPTPQGHPCDCPGLCPGAAPALPAAGAPDSEFEGPGRASAQPVVPASPVLAFPLAAPGRARAPPTALI